MHILFVKPVCFVSVVGLMMVMMVFQICWAACFTSHQSKIALLGI